MAVHHLMASAFRADPAFQEGRYPVGTPLAATRFLWQMNKLFFTHESLFEAACADPEPHAPGAQVRRAARVRDLLEMGCEAGIRPYDPNCFIATLSAVNTHDLAEGCASLAEGVRRILCPVLVVNVDTDQEFPPRFAQELADLLNAVRPGQATLRILRSPWGHLGCVRELGQLEAILREWLPA